MHFSSTYKLINLNISDNSLPLNWCFIGKKYSFLKIINKNLPQHLCSFFFAFYSSHYKLSKITQY